MLTIIIYHRLNEIWGCVFQLSAVSGKEPVSHKQASKRTGWPQVESEGTQSLSCSVESMAVCSAQSLWAPTCGDVASDSSHRHSGSFDPLSLVVFNYPFYPTVHL